MRRLGPRGIAALLVFVLSTFAGIYFATQLNIAYPAPIQRPMREALAINLTYYWLWGLFVPLVIWMAKRFRFERDSWPKALAAHAGWSIFLTLLQIIFAEWILRMTSAQLLPPRTLAGAVIDNFHSDLPTYWIILFAYYSFDYYVKYRDREVRAAQLETRLSQAQLQALKMQLNPHFLFNTLNTISSLMYTDIDAADAMMSRLSELLRLTLEKDATQEVTLKEEIELLDRYLAIERIRFEDRLDVRMDVAADVLEARVPNFSLQPLVENAIKHGIATRPEGGRLDIRAARENGSLHITLHDDGPGLQPGGAPRREGIGVANTRARLAQLYGASHRFAMANSPEGGLVVDIEIPFHA